MKAQYVTRLINQMSLGGGERMLQNIVEMEQARGFKVIRPGDVEWLSRSLWKKSTIVSIDGNRVRLVLLEAMHQKSGAFKRLLSDINDMEMVPVVVEPHDRLSATLANWGWKCRKRGRDLATETIWYPRHDT